MFIRVMNKAVFAIVLTIAIIPAFAGNEKNYGYLALGDSVSFGLNPTILGQIPPPRPEDFTGYPQIVAERKKLLKTKKAIDASCPGETSASFLLGPPDNGCMGPGPQGQPPFRTSIGLHTNYAGTQAQFAAAELASNKHINLVTLSIGGNDLLLVLAKCTANPTPTFAACVSNLLPTVLQAYGANLAQILGTIRAHYSGTLILVKYYSPSTDPLFLQAVGALNQVMMDVNTAGRFGVTFADGFTAFQIAATMLNHDPTNADPCQAGLLIRVSATACDVHPSLAGQYVLATTVLLALRDED